MVHIRWDFEDLPNLADLERNLKRSGLVVVGQALDLRVNDGNVAGLDREHAMCAILDFLLAGATKDHARQGTVHVYGTAILAFPSNSKP